MLQTDIRPCLINGIKHCHCRWNAGMPLHHVCACQGRVNHMNLSKLHSEDYHDCCMFWLCAAGLQNFFLVPGGVAHLWCRLGSSAAVMLSVLRYAAHLFGAYQERERCSHQVDLLPGFDLWLFANACYMCNICGCSAVSMADMSSVHSCAPDKALRCYSSIIANIHAGEGPHTRTRCPYGAHTRMQCRKAG